MWMPLVLAVMLAAPAAPAHAEDDGDDDGAAQEDVARQVVDETWEILSGRDEETDEREDGWRGRSIRNVLALATLAVPWSVVGPLAVAGSGVLCGVGCVGCLSGGVFEPDGLGTLGLVSGLVGLAALAVSVVVPPVVMPVVGMVPYTLLATQRPRALIRFGAAYAVSLAAMAVAAVVSTGLVLGFAWGMGVMLAFWTPVDAAGRLPQGKAMVAVGIVAWLGLLFASVGVAEVALPLGVLGALVAVEEARHQR